MSNAAKIDIDLPSVNGFTVGGSYTPSQEYGYYSKLEAQTLKRQQTMEKQ